MSKTKKLWTFDEIQALIHLVKKHPSLYDRKDTGYNQNQTKEVGKLPCSRHIIEKLIFRLFFFFFQEIWKKISESPEITDKHRMYTQNKCSISLNLRS